MERALSCAPASYLTLRRVRLQAQSGSQSAVTGLYLRSLLGEFGPLLSNHDSRIFVGSVVGACAYTVQVPGDAPVRRVTRRTAGNGGAGRSRPVADGSLRVTAVDDRGVEVELASNKGLWSGFTTGIDGTNTRPPTGVPGKVASDHTGGRRTEGDAVVGRVLGVSPDGTDLSLDPRLVDAAAAVSAGASAELTVGSVFDVRVELVKDGYAIVSAGHGRHIGLLELGSLTEPGTYRAANAMLDRLPGWVVGSEVQAVVVPGLPGKPVPLFVLTPEGQQTAEGQEAVNSTAGFTGVVQCLLICLVSLASLTVADCVAAQSVERADRGARPRWASHRVSGRLPVESGEARRAIGCRPIRGHGLGRTTAAAARYQPHFLSGRRTRG
jgi:hypothetical protein